MTWTTEDEAHLVALEAIVDSGILSVEYGGPPARKIQYQSTEQMRSVLAALKIRKAQAAGTRQSYRLAATRKGL